VRRVAVIVVVWLSLLVAAGTAYVRSEGDAALALGSYRHFYRTVLQGQILELSHSRPGIVWLGDSTILALRATSYPQILQGVLPNVTSRVAGYIGSDFYTYYPFVTALLAVHRPAVLVMVAHLRLFASPSASHGLTTRNDLVSLVPTAELPRTLCLPFDVRGMTIPRLLLARLLRYEWIERAVLLADGARARVSEAQVDWLGPDRPPDPTGSIRNVFLALAESDVPVTRHNPTVRMMEATVRVAREAGVRVIVVGTPIPFEDMREFRGYDAAVYDARFAVLRAAVEEAGGVFVDLHEALTRGQFTDPVGHFALPGATVLADRLRPIVARELGASLWDTFIANHAATAR
jgi:hypothetical protein